MKPFYHVVGVFILINIIIQADTRSHLAEAVILDGKPGLSTACSKILCTEVNVTKIHKAVQRNCSFLDNCKCEILDLKNYGSGSYASNINCPKLPALRLVYDRKGQILVVACRENTDGFDSFYEELSEILAIVRPKGLKVFSCNKKGVEWDFHNGCKTSTQSFSDDYDMLQAVGPIFDKIRALVLTENCITELKSPFPPRSQYLKTLDFSSNLLTKLPDKAFNHLHFLGELILTRNQITTLTSLSFNGLYFLHTLDISSNRLTSIAEDALVPLRFLLMLRLNNNQLHTLPAAVFSHQNVMFQLNLGGNFLETLPVNTFENLTYLYDLSLKDNRLSFLPDFLFDGLMQLEQIELQGNRLATLPTKFFQSNIRLKRLDLSNNLFTDLALLSDSLKFVARLVDLKLANNNITTLTIPLNTWRLIAERMDLSHNCLANFRESITDSPIRHDFKTFKFICTDCCIKKLTRNLVLGVSSADFKNNRIDTVDMEFLKLIAKMEEIDISYNTLRNADIRWEYPLVDIADRKPSKTVIRFYHNPVTCDCNTVPFLEFLANVSSPPIGLQRSKMFFDVSDVYCLEPYHLMKTQFRTLLSDTEKLAKLICSNTTKQCPTNCHCDNVVDQNIMTVNCTSRELRILPQLGHFKQTLHLHLENNTISNFSSLPTNVWSNINELYLDNNNLSSTENLIVFPNLRKLSLSNNSFTSIPESMKSSLITYNVSLFLSGNPWSCSSEFLEMMDLFKKKNTVVDYSDVTCVLPSSSKIVSLSLAKQSSIYQKPVANNLQAIILPTIASIIILLGVSAAVVYRYKEIIRLWIFRSSDSEAFVMESQ